MSLRVRTAMAMAAALMLALITDRADAAGIEDSIVGHYKANGIVIDGPSNPKERMFCRLVGEKLAVSRYRLAGRCARPSGNARVVLTIEVIAPGKRYGLDVSLRGIGLQEDVHYSGRRVGARTEFSATVTIDGKRYRSVFVLTEKQGGIDRIVQTLTDRATGKSYTAVNLKVTRE